MSCVDDFDSYAYLKARTVLPTWWVRFGKGQASGPFGTQQSALSFVWSELITMGYHGGCEVRGQFTGQRLMSCTFDDGSVGRDPYCGVWTDENLDVFYDTKDKAQVFKKVGKNKK